MVVPLIVIILFLVFLLIALIIYMISLYNKLSVMNINILKEYSNIDIDLKKRSDLIPKLVDVIKGYMEHEQSTLNQLIETRNKLIDSNTKEQLNEADREVSQILKNIFALAENYPDLKASANFIQLQEEINHIEDDIATRREMYNRAVQIYNNKYMMFPTKIFASILGFKQQEYFKISEEEKEMPEIKFD